MESTDFFIEFLKSGITPVALISGVGLLLLTITNRLGRTIDRTRQLISVIDKPDVQRKDEKRFQIRILYKRSKFLRTSIAAITVSVIASSLMIPTLALMTFYSIDLLIVGYILFILSTLTILISAIYFFLDVRLTLKALKVEGKDYL